MAHICDKCGDTLIMKVVHEGTPYEDYDGFICPTCEQREKEEREQYEGDNADILKLIRDAEDLKRTIKTRRPFEGLTDWDKINRWYSQALQRFM